MGTEEFKAPPRDMAVYVDHQVHWRLRKVAAELGISLKDAANQAMRAWLESKDGARRLKSQ